MTEKDQVVIDFVRANRGRLPRLSIESGVSYWTSVKISSGQTERPHRATLAMLRKEMK